MEDDDASIIMSEGISLHADEIVDVTCLGYFELTCG